VLKRAASARTVSQVDLTAVKEILKGHSDLSPLIARAASIQACDFQRDYSLGLYLQFSEYTTVRTAARWIAAECAVAISEGRPADAVRRAALIFRMARHAAQSEDGISYITSISLDTIALRVLESAIHAGPDRAEVLTAVHDVLHREWHEESFARSLHGDLVMYKVTLDNLKSQGPKYEYGPSSANTAAADEITNSFAKYVFAGTGMLNGNGANVFRSMRQLSKVADKPYPESAAGVAKITDELAAGGFDTSLASDLLSAYREVPAAKARLLARIRVLDSAAAVLKWNTRNTSLPDRLKEVLKTAPTDPFDLKSLRYRRDGNGFTLYSVGESARFCGQPTDKKQYNLEAVFTFPAPKYLTEPEPPAR